MDSQASNPTGSPISIFKHEDYGYTLLCPAFVIGAGDLNSGPLLVKQALFPLTQLPSAADPHF